MVEGNWSRKPVVVTLEKEEVMWKEKDLRRGKPRATRWPGASWDRHHTIFPNLESHFHQADKIRWLTVCSRRAVVLIIALRKEWTITGNNTDCVVYTSLYRVFFIASVIQMGHGGLCPLVVNCQTAFPQPQNWGQASKVPTANWCHRLPNSVMAGVDSTLEDMQILRLEAIS